MRIKFRHEKSYGLIGNPLGHSMSPVIHRELLLLRGISADYELYEVSSEELPGFYADELTQLSGFNVTIPHKLNIIPLLDELSPRAELFGSVNTVFIDGGRGIGYNTDCTGFLRSLDGAGIELGGSVLILGAGGVSRMFAFESVLAGAKVALAVRETGLSRAYELQKEIAEKLGGSVEVITLDNALCAYDLIINGTPVGMSPNVDASPLSEDVVSKAGAVFDAVYNPSETLLLSYAKKNGIKHVNGLPMLVWQAAAAEEIWNGTSYTKQEIEGIIRELEK